MTELARRLGPAQVDRVAAPGHAPEARPGRAGRRDRQVPARASSSSASPSAPSARSTCAGSPLPELERLARLTHETTGLGILDGDIAARPSPRSTARTSSRSATGPGGPRRCTASPPARSCCRPSPSARSCGSSAAASSSYTERTIVELEPLLEELARIRRRGYATAIGEYELGLNAVAAPIHDARGNVIAAVDIWGPAFRLTPRRIPELAAQAREAAAAISVRLGGTVARARAGPHPGPRDGLTDTLQRTRQTHQGPNGAMTRQTSAPPCTCARRRLARRPAPMRPTDRRAHALRTRPPSRPRPNPCRP